MTDAIATRMGKTIIGVGVLFSFVLVSGCATLNARPPAQAQKASLAVLCTDPDIYAPARWCYEETGKPLRAQR